MQLVTAEAPAAAPAPLQSIWTKECRSALARANRVLFDFLARPADAKSWDPQKVLVIFLRDEVKEKGKKYIPEERLTFEFEGFIRRGHLNAVETSEYQGHTSHSFERSEANAFHPASGMWSFSVYHGSPGVEETAMLLIPIGAKVRFEVALDYLANGYAAKARLHGDVLLASFTKGKQKGLLQIDTTVLEHNSARFGATVR